MKSEKIHKEKRRMIVMDVKIDNFIALKNFHLNMSYPKRIVGSYIKDEFLKGRPNFRYKKINILMGSNATGKTSVGKMLMRIFNFMDKKEYTNLTDVIGNSSKEASFSIDFIGEEYILYRVKTIIFPKKGDKYQSSDINVTVGEVKINAKDSYETCAKYLDEHMNQSGGNYIEELEKVKGLSWIFQYPFDDSGEPRKIFVCNNTEKYLNILEKVLQTLDPAITKVEKSDEIENTYIVRLNGQAVIIQDGKIHDANILSSGTKSGIEIAGMLTSILEGEFGFYYCDEKFSYIHSDIEKAILSVMIDGIRENEQLFFTTHNTEILELPLPKHSFIFLKKDIHDEEQPIKCISASSLLKRNTDSLKNAVENDLFSAAPNLDLIYNVAELYVR